ncbi:hypothetical protein P43SY_004368 [Pythium insidiosum]|uniref:Suppressor of forked domain-containing protein n=1 Tax=Pythium insidiosum TaxID=114742 RepID=A0AAD5LJV0_PYTIN|nr:hypothetical protein P43SY_004368 [Pythium insidiosum]
MTETTAKTPVERLNEAVTQNPLDFNSWVQLLALAESETSLPRETVESTYERFLVEFPLCFGYWNKYAQYELNLGKAADADTPPRVDPADAVATARAIFERGVRAARHSIHMWQKYCEFLINTARVPVDEARAALEGAVAACANEPAAGPLWDMYIQLETIQNDMFRLNQVFKRVLQQPLSNLEEFWDKYNHFVLAQQLNVLATPEELAAIGAEEEMDEGLLRVKIVNSVETIKNKTAEAISKRQSFEARIDRNYFHVTPVTADSLSNWHSYLDYEEIVGDKMRCELLYERCLISCANYEQMWVRYAQWKERVDGFDAANAVFQRAVTIFLKRRASIYLEYATFLEAHGKFSEARATYMRVLDELAPQLGEAYIRYANFERRQGKTDVVKAWYERALERLEAQPAVFGFVAVSYATFTHRNIGDTDATRAIYQRTTSKVTGSIVLWLSYIHFEISLGGADMVSRVESIFTAALAEITDLSNDEKNDLWLQFGEFMETYTDDITRTYSQGYTAVQPSTTAAASTATSSAAYDQYQQYAAYYQQQQQQ